MNRGAARALIRLADAGGRALSFATIAARPGQSEDVDPSNLAKSYVCHARAALKSAGVACEISAIRHYGYRMEPAAADRLRAILGEARP